ncbi:hypothetical protein L6452_06234 [Arctium lappa]|uniref:Uncharacterized protein n=1 Tax=Arctium lappa TaxID=4217 RepID=A0ACB9EI47_ARCLA|nr:hypothetical protein L6452_06234 [Arctium lappa]
MAMRPRGGRAGPNREPRFNVGRVYEPFKPMSEWRQDEDYDTLLVYLPGFQKEYIKVTIEDLNIVRVRGERLVADNKWSRFQEDFRVPENCEMSGVRARFDGGILTITMPRKIITVPPPPPPPTTRVAPKSTQVAQKSTQVAPKSEETKTKQQQNADKDEDNSKERATSSNAALESEKKPEKTQSPALEEGGTSTLAPQSQPMPTKQEPLKTADGDEFGSSVPKKNKDNGTVEKPNDNKGKSKEAVVEEENKMQGESKGGKVEENAVVKGGNNGWKKGLNEDRRMVVNMCVGVLVIVALGIHVSYTIGLIGKGK